MELLYRKIRQPKKSRGTVRYLDSGRVSQKLRTRAALLEVAVKLMRERKPFGVADVADLAKVGRTTAYRYFPTIERLLADATLWAATKGEQAEFERKLDEIDSVSERLKTVVDISDRSTAEHEVEYRTMLRLSLDPGQDAEDLLPKRAGLRAALLDEALQSIEPEIGRDAYRRLTAALSLFIGIEATIVLKDVCGLSPQEAREVKLWGARALLDTAMREAAENKINQPSRHRASTSTAGTKRDKRRT